MVEDRVWGSGDTFLSFLQDNGMPLDLYYKLDSEDEKLLMDIRMATVYQLLRDRDGSVRQILLPLSDELQIQIVKQNDGSYSLAVIPIIYDVKKRSFAITFEDIPSKDIVKKSENFDLSIEVEQLFRKIVDFKKIQKGDHLVVFYEEKLRLGKPFGEQKIEAAMIEQKGKKHYQFLALDGRYYNEKGKSTGKSSFIVPCRYKRISSKFTNKRWHPILKRYRAHHGIDYAVSTGTHIKAAYSGKVIFAGRKGGYGKTVIVKHNAGYRTLYAHLSRFKTHVGAKVKTGDLIALSGNTGRSTGPHLHFGLSQNGRWINPALKIVFVKGLSGSKRRAFMKYSKIYRQKIENMVKSNTKDMKNIPTLEEVDSLIN